MKLISNNLKKTGSGYLEGDLNALDEASVTQINTYRRRVSCAYIAVSGDDVTERFKSGELIATRKIDGELAFLCFDGKEAVIVNSGGRVRSGLACTDEAAEALKKAGVKQCLLGAELHADESEGRTRVYDVLSALADADKAAGLHLSPFDVVQLDDGEPEADGYADIHETLGKLFGKTKLCTPVPVRKLEGASALSELYSEWVEGENAEGIIVRGDFPMVFKVKPRHTIDMVVVGYVLNEEEKLRELLLAVCPEEGRYQVIGQVGSGFNDKEKAALLKQLAALHAESDYVAPDSRNVAFQLVKPEMVVEVAVTDLLPETSRGVVRNPVLDHQKGKYEQVAFVPGVSLIHAAYIRPREDKRVSESDTGLSQITRLVALGGSAEADVGELPESEVLLRDVYTKESKGKTMVQKFIAWKTNKAEKDDRYPAYVFHYTNYSPGRGEPLKRDVRVSSSEDQIREIATAFVEKNIKKGWEQFEG